MRKITGETTLTGIVGYPVRYSLSPIFQNFLFEKYNLNWIYVPFPVEKKDRIEDVIRALFEAGVKGLNVTIPYKEAVVKIADFRSSLVEVAEAANTLVDRDGKIHAYNTDGPGFWDGMELTHQIKYQETALYILGGGGAAKGIAGEAILRNVKEITVFVRDPGKYSSYFKQQSSKFNIKITVEKWEKLKTSTFLSSSIIVNATPLGMKGETIPLSWKFQNRGNTIIADVVYLPAETPLIKQARKRGIKTVDGITMLASQGVKSFEIWTGLKADIISTVSFLREYLNENSSGG